MPNAIALKAVISLDNRDFERGIKQSADSTKSFEKTADESGKKLQWLDRMAMAAGTGVAKSFGVIAAGARGVAAPFQVAGKAFDGLAGRAEAFNTKIENTRHKFQQIGEAAHTLSTPLNLAGSALAKLGNIGRNALAGLGGVGLGSLAALTAALGVLGKRGVEVNLQLSGAEATFRTLFKSADVAAKFMDALRKESLSSAFEFTDLSRYSEALGAFGFQAKEIIPVIRTLGDTARGNSEKMERLVLAFGQIKAKGVLQGDEAMQLTEAGIPVRDILKVKPGTDISDAKLTANQAIPQLLGGLNGMFGGLQAQAVKSLPGIMSNLSDALNEVTSKATTKLVRSLTMGAQRVLDAVNRAAEGGLGKSLAAIFDTAGKAVEAFTAKLPAMVDWLAQVFTVGRVRMFFINGIALAETFGQTLADLFGVDLKAAMDPKNANGFFDALGEGLKKGIDALFGMGRVWKELQIIIKGWAVDAKDLLTDWAEDIGRVFKSLFFGLQASIQSLTAALLKSIISVLDAYNQIAGQLNKSQIFKYLTGGGLPEAPTAGLYKAQLGASADAAISSGQIEQQGIDQGHANQERGVREQRKDQADRFRYFSPEQRIADAFSGRNRDTSAQDTFWSRFQANRMGTAQGLYQGAAAGPPPPLYPGNGIPGMFLGRYADQPSRGPSVTPGRDAYLHPSIPQYVPPSAAGVQGPPPMLNGAGYGGANAQVTPRQIVINYDAKRGISREDWEAFRKMYEQMQREESTRSGMIGPAG